MPKKEPKKVKPSVKGEDKSPPDAELTEDQLEQVAGGAAVDYFLKLDGIQGESTDHKHKDLIEYTPTTPLPNKLFKI